LALSPALVYGPIPGGNSVKPPANYWPDSSTARGVLFFAQHMREMLTQASFESFRATTLDLTSKLDELLDTIEEIEASHLPITTIEPVLAEVLTTLKDDPVARESVASEIELLEHRMKTDGKKIDPTYLTGLVTLLIKRLGSDYGEQLEASILSCYNHDNRRNNLRKACAAYCSHLVNIGYSKIHLLEIIKERFFTGDIGKIEKRTLQRFFSSFSKEDKQFRIWVATPVTTANFLRKLDLQGVDVSKHIALPADVRAAFSAEPDFNPSNRYVTRCVKAKDRYAAVNFLNQSLASIESFIILSREGFDLRWNSRAYVRTPRAIQGAFVSASSFILQGPGAPATGGAAALVRTRVKRALTQFDAPSTERLLSAVNTAALARTTPNLENHLISLWSAIEVLLSNPPANIPRIVHYVELLAPCICIGYVRRYIVAAYEALRTSYTGPMQPLIDSVEPGKLTDDYSRFTHLIFDPAYRSQRDRFMTMLNRNPLALHRMWKLHKNFGTPDAYGEAVAGHERRVRWQLHRIYRTRNQLVHAGVVPVYLEPLVLNMLEYFRATITAVVTRASKEEELSDVDQVVTEIGVDFEIARRQVQAYKAPAFASEDYRLFYR
jgi:hypothetical protein